MFRLFNHYFHAWTVQRIAADVLLALLALSAVVAVQADNLSMAWPGAGPQILALAAGLLLINSIAGLYQRGQMWSTLEAAVRGLLALGLAWALTVQVFRLLPISFGNTAAIRTAALLVIGALIVRRAVVSRWAAKARAGARVLVFGAGPSAAAVGETVHQIDPLATVVGYLPGPNEAETAVPAKEVLPFAGTLAQTAQRLGVDEIVVAVTERRAGSMPLRELLDCKLAGVRVFDMASYYERLLGQIRLDVVNASWLIFGEGFNQGPWRTGVKRVFDLLSSVVLIVVALPIMAITAIAIKLESKGPVLYRQERVGLNGHTFDVVKFRSMRTDAEKDGPQWAKANDSRVTRVGGFIRKVRIDELPQLFNVLRGDMSMVGPRPERPVFVDQLTQQIPYYAVRHSIKPGVTGWAQVRCDYGSTIEETKSKLQYDLYYVKNHSLMLDLVVVFETIGVVLTGKGAR